MPITVISINAPIFPKLKTLLIRVDHFTLMQLIKVDETKNQYKKQTNLKALYHLTNDSSFYILLMMSAAIRVTIFLETKQLPNIALYKYSALVKAITATDPGVIAR